MIHDVIVTKISQIPVSGGDVMHVMRLSDSTFKGFGEAYFSKITFESIKAWKKHTEMFLNLVVPVGEVLFYLIDDRAGSVTNGGIMKVRLSNSNYNRLTIPPGVWLGFKGLSKIESLILNVASLPHSESEVLRLPTSHFNVDWTDS